MTDGLDLLDSIQTIINQFNSVKQFIKAIVKFATPCPNTINLTVTNCSETALENRLRRALVKNEIQ